MTATGRQTVTIYEVAKRAGVSIATVSRTLSGSPVVAESTRRRVQAIVDELGFQPSRLGQSLADGRHAANGIVFPDLSGPYYAEVVLGYEEVAAEFGSSVLIVATHNRPNPVERVLDLARRVDGMVLMGRTVTDEVATRIQRSGLPLVLLARPEIGGADTLNTDNKESARRLVQHLVGHGHRRLAFLGDPAESPDVAGRYEGFRIELRAAGLSVPRAPVRCGFDVMAGRTAARSILSRPNRPDALVCANDEIALGALEAASDMKLSVPGGVAITGWDDVMAARYAGLTTVHQAMRQLGATAARWLQERISGSNTEIRHEVLDTQLVIRSTCGRHGIEMEDAR